MHVVLFDNMKTPPQALPYPSRGWRGGGLRCPPTVKDWGLTITSQYASLVHFLCFVVWYSTVAPPNYEKSTCNSWPVAGDRWCSWRHAARIQCRVLVMQFHAELWKENPKEIKGIYVIIRKTLKKKKQILTYYVYTYREGENLDTDNFKQRSTPP